MHLGRNRRWVTLFSTKVQEIISIIIAHKHCHLILARSRNKPPSNEAYNELKNSPQMVSISKLYFNLRKKLLFVSVLPIEKVRSHHMTLGILNRGNTHRFQEFYAPFFARKQI